MTGHQACPDPTTKYWQHKSLSGFSRTGCSNSENSQEDFRVRLWRALFQEGVNRGCTSALKHNVAVRIFVPTLRMEGLPMRAMIGSADARK